MTASIQTITIKGTKDGLHFRFCANSFDTLMAELHQKLNVSHTQFLQGPLTHAFLYLGTLYINEEQRAQLVQAIESAGNLIVKGIYSDVISVQEANDRLRLRLPKVQVGPIRSGQVIESEQDVLILGDVNPGGWVISHGNIFIMGALKGYAHAGSAGDRDKIIAASHMEPLQLRIANLIASTFDDLSHSQAMKFAYVEDDLIVQANIQSLSKIRPELTEFTFKEL